MTVNHLNRPVAGMSNLANRRQTISLGSLLFSSCKQELYTSRLYVVTNDNVFQVRFDYVEVRLALI